MNGIQQIFVIGHKTPEKELLATELKHSLGNLNRGFHIITNFGESYEEISQIASEHPAALCVGVKAPGQNIQALSKNNLIENAEDILRETKRIVVVDAEHHPDRNLIEVLAHIAGTQNKVVITGTARSGKSTLTENIEKTLGYKHLSAGNEVARIFAAEQSMSLDSCVALMETDKGLAKKYDDRIDAWNREQLATKDHICLESRLGALWAGDDTLKVLLCVDDMTAGKRLLNRIKDHPEEFTAEEKAYTIEDAMSAIVARNRRDMVRYLDKYDFDYTDQKNYDFFINSVETSKEEMLDAFLKGYKKSLISKIK